MLIITNYLHSSPILFFFSNDRLCATYPSHSLNENPNYLKSLCYPKWGPAACCSRANKRTRLVKRKSYSISDASN